MGKLSRGASADARRRSRVERGVGDGTLALIRAAVADGVQIELDYRSSRGDAERRRVDPLRVESIDDDWYLRGWCHLREAVRTFRLDRISNAVVTESRSSTARTTSGCPTCCSSRRRTTSRSTSRWRPPRCRCSSTTSRRARIVTEAGDRIRTTLRVSHYHGLKRLVASMPGVVRVVAPEQARRAVADVGRGGRRTVRVRRVD